MPHVRSGSAEIYYEIHGSGPTLVLAHGAGGNRVIWFQQVPVFAQRYRVVTFDHRCFGRSTCPPEDFHPKHFTSDLLAILDAEGIERAALVCQSMGGWTGLSTAVRHPERVACLALCGTPGGLVTPTVLAAAARIGQNASRDGIRGQAALAPDFPERRPDLAFLYDQVSGLNVDFPMEALARMFDPEGRVDPADLADYAIPTLLVAGEHDGLFPPEALREVAKEIPGCAWCDIPGAGHSTYFEDAEQFNAHVGDFVAQHLNAAARA